MDNVEVCVHPASHSIVSYGDKGVDTFVVPSTVPTEALLAIVVDRLLNARSDVDAGTLAKQALDEIPFSRKRFMDKFDAECRERLKSRYPNLCLDQNAMQCLAGEAPKCSDEKPADFNLVSAGLL
jgi:hypothetical protein